MAVVGAILSVIEIREVTLVLVEVGVMLLFSVVVNVLMGASAVISSFAEVLVVDMRVGA